MPEGAKEELTPEEAKELQQLLGGNYPSQEEKTGVYNFFNRVLKTDNTSKVSYLDDNELSSIRVLQNVSLYADEMGLDVVSKYLAKKAEVVLATALSKKGFLINAIVTTKKELRIKDKNKGEKSSWFRKKEQEQD